MFVWAGLLTHTVFAECWEFVAFLLVYILIPPLFVSSSFLVPPNNATEMSFRPINNSSEAPGGSVPCDDLCVLMMSKTHACVFLHNLEQLPQSKAEFTFDQIEQNSFSEITVLCP